jgi:hypothetical protein
VAAAAWAVAATGSITAGTNLAKTFLCLNSERWRRGGAAYQVGWSPMLIRQQIREYWYISGRTIHNIDTHKRLVNDAYMQRYKLVAITMWLNPRLSTWLPPKISFQDEI